jgi:cytochrome P450
VGLRVLPEHERLRGVSLPPFRIPRSGSSGRPTWIVTRPDNAREVLSHPGLTYGLDTGEDHMEGHWSELRRDLFNARPPEHTRLRGLVARAFAPQRIARLEPRMETIASGLLAAIAAHDVVDIVDVYASPFQLCVLCDLLGVPTESRAFDAWPDTLAGAGGGGLPQLPMARALRALRRPGSGAVRAFLTYIEETLGDERRMAPGGLVSTLAALHHGGELTRIELMSMVFMLLAAGNTETNCLIGSAIYLALAEPPQAALLRSQPDLLAPAVEEVLRCHTPVRLVGRRAAEEPVSVCGVTVPRGDEIIVSLCSRDVSGQHLAFGYGIHYCLGAALARLECQVALRALLGRFPDAGLDIAAADVVWDVNPVMHGPDALPVRLTARPASARC